MDNPRPDLAGLVALKVIDLRAEFEAQLRALGRLEDQLRKTKSTNSDDRRGLAEVLRRELAEMLANNTSIRTVLTDLSTEGRPLDAASV
jgi:hypothetical protein